VDRWCGTLDDGSAICTDTGKVAPVPGQRVTKIAAGGKHTCVLLDDGSVACWGDNRWGQLGLGNMPGPAAKVGPQGPLTRVDFKQKKAVDIAAGHAHTCALLEDAKLMCWGAADNSAFLSISEGGWNGVTHHWETEPTAVPVNDVTYASGKYQSTPHAVKAFFTEGDTTCVLREDARVRCWSSGASPGSTPMNGGGLDLPAGVTATRVELSRNNTCVVLSNGDATCSGRNDSGQLGTGDTYDADHVVPTYPPLDFGPGLTAKQIAIGDRHACAVLADGRVKCWGSGGGLGSWGFLGTGSRENRGDQPGEMGSALAFTDLRF
jgi:alpha-tubulin suppressor-like RCC1 family protein